MRPKLPHSHPYQQHRCIKSNQIQWNSKWAIQCSKRNLQGGKKNLTSNSARESTREVELETDTHLKPNTYILHQCIPFVRERQRDIVKEIELSAGWSIADTFHLRKSPPPPPKIQYDFSRWCQQWILYPRKGYWQENFSIKEIFRILNFEIKLLSKTDEQVMWRGYVWDKKHKKEKNPNSVICWLRKPQNILHLDAIAKRKLNEIAERNWMRPQGENQMRLLREYILRVLWRYTTESFEGIHPHREKKEKRGCKEGLQKLRGHCRPAQRDGQNWVCFFRCCQRLLCVSMLLDKWLPSSSSSSSSSSSVILVSISPSLLILLLNDTAC